MKDERYVSGLRRSPYMQLTDEEIVFLKSEIQAIEADENVFVFNQGRTTGYLDNRDIINVRANVFSNETSTHPRDLMSARAVLAHEFYGHRANRGTSIEQGRWNDEFRASYFAAKNTPNLTVQDRAYLVMDAIERAREAGVSIRYNNFMSPAKNCQYP